MIHFPPWLQEKRLRAAEIKVKFQAAEAKLKLELESLWLIIPTNQQGQFGNRAATASENVHH